MINAAGVARDVIVIGASAGGFQAVIQLLGSLPSDLPAVTAVVIHRSPHYVSRLAALLERATNRKTIEAYDGLRLAQDAVLIAPQDRHMIIEDGYVRVTRDPKEHFTRPAIDPLFRSAAATYGARVVGVVLTGFGGDGVAGLRAIAAAGGVTLVQEPTEAAFPNLPVRAIREASVHGVFTLDRLAQVLTALASGETVAP